MSYYTIRPSTPNGPREATVGFTGQNPEHMRPLLTPAGGFRTRDVNRNETVQGQLDGLLRSDSSYITRARNSASNAYAMRGGLNTSAAAGAAEGAAIESALPIASQDASWYGQTHADNMGAENDYLRQQADIGSAWNLANLSASTQSEIAQLGRDENARQFDAEQANNVRDFGESQRRYDTDYQRSIEDQARTNTMNRNNFIQSGIFQTIFSDPTIWRDPEGAMGFANYYGTNFQSLWDSIFGNGTPAPAAP